MRQFNSSAAASSPGSEGYPYSVGFELLDKAKAAKEALDKSGVFGLFELIGAIMARGPTTQSLVVEEVVSIGGEWYRDLTVLALELGNKVPACEWIQQIDGSYSL